MASKTAEAAMTPIDKASHQQWRPVPSPDRPQLLVLLQKSLRFLQVFMVSTSDVINDELLQKVRGSRHKK